MVKIVIPSLEFYLAFESFIEEMRAHGETLWTPYVREPSESAGAFIERLLRRRNKPEDDMVPETVYWGIVGSDVVGRIALRHRLEGNLHEVGGHIGYEVRPSFRRRGIAREMLKQVLKSNEAQSIGKLLLTCAPGNVASNRTIIVNGGHFSKMIFVDLIQAERNHYWINLENK